MQYSQEHLKTMVYAKFGGQTECIMGNSKIKNAASILKQLFTQLSFGHLDGQVLVAKFG